MIINFTLTANAQIKFGHFNDLQFNGTTNELTLATSGGINSGQFFRFDLDNDGLNDLVIFDRYNNRFFTFLFENNTLVYAPEFEYSFPSDIDAFALLYDYNCDGRKDLFTSTVFGIKVYKNISAGNGVHLWQEAADFLRTETFSGVTNLQVNSSDIPGITDIDNDGDLDIFVYNFATGGFIRFHKNLSVENFGHCDSLVYRLESTQWGSFEECDCEIIAIDETCESISGRIEHVGGKSLLFFDRDGDGDQEVVIGEEQCTDVFYLENSGNPLAEQFLSFTKDFPSGLNKIDFNLFPAIFFDDFDFDGLPDLLAAPNFKQNIGNLIDFSSSVHLYKNTGTGLPYTFENEQSGFLQNDMIDVGENARPVLFDIDQDGDQDLFIGNRGNPTENTFASSLYFFENTTSFNLVSTDFLQLSELGFLDIHPAFVNINNDPFTDLVFLAHRDFVPCRLYMIPGAQPGSGTSFQFNTSGIDSLSFEFGQGSNLEAEDYNQDGFTDLIIATRESIGGTLAYLRNDRNGHFVEDKEVEFNFDNSFENRNLSVTIDDFDDDGKLDLISSDFSGVAKFYSNFLTSPSTFEEKLIENVFSDTLLTSRLGERSFLTSADIDNDGQPDIIAGLSTGGIIILENRTPVSGVEVDLDFFTIFPVPVFGDYLKINSSLAANFEIVSIFGQKLSDDISINPNETIEIDVKNLSNGIYIIRGVSSVGVSAKRFIVQK